MSSPQPTIEPLAHGKDGKLNDEPRSYDYQSQKFNLKPPFDFNTSTNLLFKTSDIQEFERLGRQISYGSLHSDGV
jgi:hypothetical protein